MTYSPWINPGILEIKQSSLLEADVAELKLTDSQKRALAVLTDEFTEFCGRWQTVQGCDVR